MGRESTIEAQIVRLFRQHPHRVWELIEAKGPAQAGDVSIQDLDGTTVAYARPATKAA